MASTTTVQHRQSNRQKHPENHNRTAAIDHAIRDTAAVFDWLIAALSYQGISDQIAYDYMEQHGYVRWNDINEKLARGATCPKLKSYWHFHGCGYSNSAGHAPSQITSPLARCRPTTCVAHLNRRLSRESWLIAVQPISFMSRSISVCIRPSARSTPAWPAAAKGKR